MSVCRLHTKFDNLIDIIHYRVHTMDSHKCNNSLSGGRRRQRFHRFATVSIFLNIIILLVTISDNEVQAFQSSILQPISQRHTSTTINDIIYARQRQSTNLMANDNNNDLLPNSLKTIRTASTNSKL